MILWVFFFLWLLVGKYFCGFIDCYIGGDVNDLNLIDVWKYNVS